MPPTFDNFLTLIVEVLVCLWYSFILDIKLTYYFTFSIVY